MFKVNNYRLSLLRLFWICGISILTSSYTRISDFLTYRCKVLKRMLQKKSINWTWILFTVLSNIWKIPRFFAIGNHCYNFPENEIYFVDLLWFSEYFTEIILIQEIFWSLNLLTNMSSKNHDIHTLVHCRKIFVWFLTNKSPGLNVSVERLNLNVKDYRQRQKVSGITESLKYRTETTLKSEMGREEGWGARKC